MPVSNSGDTQTMIGYAPPCPTKRDFKALPQKRKFPAIKNTYPLMKSTSQICSYLVTLALGGVMSSTAWSAPFLDEFSTDTSASYLGTNTYGSGGSFNVSGGSLNVDPGSNNTYNVFHNSAQLAAGEFTRVTIPSGSEAQFRLTVSTTTRGPNTGTEDGIRFFLASTTELRSETYRDGSATTISYGSHPAGWTGDLTMYVLRDTNTSYRVGYDTGSGVVFLDTITIAETAGQAGMFVGVEGYSGGARAIKEIEIGTASFPVINSFTASEVVLFDTAPVTFTWSASNATSVTLNGQDVTGQPPLALPVGQTQDFTLVATGSGGGTITKTIAVTVSAVNTGDDFETDTSGSYTGTTTVGNTGSTFDVSGGKLNLTPIAGATYSVFNSSDKIRAGQFVRVTVPLGTQPTVGLSVSSSAQSPNVGVDDGIRLILNNDSLSSNTYRDGFETIISYPNVVTGWTGDLKLYIIRDGKTTYRIGYDTGSGVTIVDAITIAETSSQSALFVGVEATGGARAFDNLQIGSDAANPFAGRKVLFIGIDGLRADAIAPANTPNIDALMANGSTTLHCYHGGVVGTATEQITVSGPGWATMLNGVWVDKHLVDSNVTTGTVIDMETYPAFMRRVKELVPTARASSIVSWQDLQTIYLVDSIEPGEPDFLDYSASADAGLSGTPKYDNVRDKTLAEITNEDPDVLFVHFSNPDYTGHSNGGFVVTPPSNYITSVETVDGYVGALVSAIQSRPAAADEDWLIIFSSDHGGSGTSHGAQTPEDRLVPLIVAGGEAEVNAFSTESVPATVIPRIAFRHLGLAENPAWGWEPGPTFGFARPAFSVSQNGNTVNLNWTLPAGGILDLTGYEVFRDGVSIESLPVSADTYQDLPPVPSSGSTVVNYELRFTGTTESPSFGSATVIAPGFTGLIHNLTAISAFDGESLPTGYRENISTGGSIIYDSLSSGYGRFTSTSQSGGDTRLITGVPTGLGASDGWTAEMKFQVSALGEAGEAQFIIRSGRDVYIWITNGGIYGGINTTSSPLFIGDMTTAMQTLRVVYDPLDTLGSGDTLRFFLDGVESTMSTTWLPGTTSTDQVYFGDSSSSIDDADTHIDYVNLNDRPVIPLTGIALWKRINFLGSSMDELIAGDTVDNDGDGLNNLMEYALNFDPHVFTRRIGMTSELSGSDFSITYPRNVDADDLDYTIEASETMEQGTWNSVSVTEENMGTSRGTEMIKASMTPGSGNRYFARLRVQYK